MKHDASETFSPPVRIVFQARMFCPYGTGSSRILFAACEDVLQYTSIDCANCVIVTCRDPFHLITTGGEGQFFQKDPVK